VTTGNGKPKTPTLAIAIGAGALVVIAVAAFAAIAMGAMMDGCGGMRCHGRGGAQTPVVFDGSDVTIEIRNFDFSPRDATISAGTTVTWLNEDKAPHDATSDDGAWATEVMDDGESQSLPFNEAGVFDYHCSIHPYMEGTLTVRE
jgi:plastocyanin